MLTESEIISLQPLLNRLTGQVTWCLMEENGLSPEETDAFMDVYQGWRLETLDLCREVAAGDAGPFLRLQAMDDDLNSGGPCAGCIRLAGRYIALPDRTAFAEEDAFDDAVRAVLPLLPPYSLGCRLRAVRAEDTPQAEGFISPADIPAPRLHCEDGWFFRCHWGPEKHSAESTKP